jgi:hypothetical protein
MSVDFDFLQYTNVIINILTFFIILCAALSTISNCILGSDEIENIPEVNNLINEFANNQSNANTIKKTIESIEQNKIKNQ